MAGMVRSKKRRWTLSVLLLVALVALIGCQTTSFYTQAVRGQYQILSSRQSCDKLLANPETPADLKARLEVAGEICRFAEAQLNLPANGHYRDYADINRRYVVWNVSAAPEFSLEAKTWWYPIVGSLDYRGFFTEKAAQREAARLRKKNFDACVEGVEAYSTLGWFTDPLLNTFTHHSDAIFAEILFHELAHQRVFASGDTDFNEAFATAVGQEGVRRWLSSRGDTNALTEYTVALRRNVQVAQLVDGARKKLELIYGDERNAAGKIKATRRSAEVSPYQLHREKQEVLNNLRLDYEQIKKNWDGYSGYNSWFGDDLNNAKLNSVATYYDLVPDFERLLAEKDGNLEEFYSAADKLAKLSKAERQKALQADKP